MLVPLAQALESAGAEWADVFETFLDKYGWPTLIVLALWRGVLVIGTEARSWKAIALRSIETNERLATMAGKAVDRRRQDEEVEIDRREDEEIS